MTEVEKMLCKVYLQELDECGTSNEYKLIMSLIEDSPIDDTSDSYVSSRELDLMALTGEWTELTDEIIARFIRRIRNLPSALKHGQWIPAGLSDFVCSNCGTKISRTIMSDPYEFCPYCGAKMSKAELKVIKNLLKPE